MRIQVHPEKGLANIKAGFHVTQAGEYEFPDDRRFSAWLQGQINRGTVSLVPAATSSTPPPEADGPTAGSLPVSGGDTVHSEPPPEADGLTSGSTSGEADSGHSLPPPEAEGVTSPATPDEGTESPSPSTSPASAHAPGIGGGLPGKPLRPMRGR